jgi:chromosome segregation ATPase
MITPKGERRLESIMEKFGPEVRGRMNANWRRGATGVSQSQASSVLSPAVPRSLSELKELVASHDDAERQVREIEDLVSLVDSDLDSLRSELGSLDAEIARINEIKAEMSKKIALKEGERREWEQMKALHEAEKIRLESVMGVRAQP